MSVLKALGLMRVSEHLSMLDRADRYLNDKDREIRGLNDKYKRAVTDLAAQADEIAAFPEKLGAAIAMNKRLADSMASIEADRNHWRDQALRDAPDAEAMRAKRKRDRDYQRAKATGQSVVQSDNGGGV